MRRRRLNIRLARAAAFGLAFIGQLVAVVGLPVPVRANPSAKASDTPFPCQNNPCGCVTAEQCWTSCCCTSPAEHFAWARLHGVTPPSYAARPGGWSRPRQRDEAACPHCAKAEKPAAPAEPVRWASGWCAQQCRGAGLAFLATSPALPQRGAVGWSFDWTRGGDLPPGADVPVTSPHRPTVPPPRA